MDAEVLVKAKIDANASQLDCSACNNQDICLPAGASLDLLIDRDNLINFRIHLKSGDRVYHYGSNFHGLYAVKSGFIKIENYLDNGRVQITGFYMSGEVFGFDGIVADKHTCTSVALEDSVVCIIPLDQIEHMGNEAEHLRHHFYKLMSREIIHNHTIMMLLGSMAGEERLAAFLLNLSQRLYDRGYSPYNLVLRMTRAEIGSHLGMKIESVSRLFSKFQNQGLLEVDSKNIRILNVHGLRELISQ